MAVPTTQLIRSLRIAAEKIRNGDYYAWGHHGACNCGHLLQVTTQFTRDQILAYAHTGSGEWTELAEESCRITNAPYSLLISHLEGIGLTPTDIHNIEYLEDRRVLNRLPGGFRWLRKNDREDVVLYFETFANWLEEARLKIHTPPEDSILRIESLPV